MNIAMIINKDFWVNCQKKDLIYESADLIYHLLVLLANEGIKLEEIIQELNKRHNK